MLIAIASDPLWRRNYRRLVREYQTQPGEHGVSEPEFRLPPTVVGACLVPVALFGMSPLRTCSVYLQQMHAPWPARPTAYQLLRMHYTRD